MLATCPYCQWEVWRPNADSKAKAEAAHKERWHTDVAPPTDELCDQMVAEHVGEREQIEQAIEACAVVNQGRVDPNVVRELLPPGITPQLIGAVYNVWRRRGRLEPIEQGVSNDTQGRNVGKPTTVYRLVPTHSERTQSA